MGAFWELEAVEVGYWMALKLEDGRLVVGWPWYVGFCALGGVPAFRWAESWAPRVSPPIWQLFRARQTTAKKGLTMPESLPKCPTIVTKEGQRRCKERPEARFGFEIATLRIMHEKPL